MKILFLASCLMSRTNHPFRTLSLSNRSPSMTMRENSEFFDGIRAVRAQDIATAGWVLLFDPGTEKEGVYTIQNARAISVVAFEIFDDAYKFAGALAQQDFEMASPTRWHADVLSIFCKLREYSVLIIPSGTTLRAPARNTVSVESQRDRLDVLFWQMPEQCDDDDCGVA